MSDIKNENRFTFVVKYHATWDKSQIEKYTSIHMICNALSLRVIEVTV